MVRDDILGADTDISGAVYHLVNDGGGDTLVLIKDK